MVDRPDRVITLVDIGLLPARRGQGIGTVAILDLQREATTAKSRVRLSVSHGNVRARSLYARLGFVAEGTRDLFIEMVYPA